MVKFSDLASAFTCFSTHNANLLLIGASLKNYCLLEITVNLLPFDDKCKFSAYWSSSENYCLLEITVNLLRIGDERNLLLIGVTLENYCLLEITVNSLCIGDATYSLLEFL